jgi:hypothetical protein
MLTLLDIDTYIPNANDSVVCFADCVVESVYLLGMVC